MRTLLLLETFEDWVNIVKRIVDLLAHLGAGQHHFARHKDQQHDTRFDHSVNESGEQFRLVRAELGVQQHQTLQPDGKLDVATAHHVLDLEVEKLGLKVREKNKLDYPSSLNVCRRFLPQSPISV